MQLKALTAKLEEVESKGRATKLVVIPRDRAAKLSGRPSSEQDPEVMEWAEDMRRLTKDLSDAEGVQLVLDHLTGHARDEVRLCPPERRTNAEDVIGWILATYACHETPSARWSDFYGRQQRPGESIQDYSLHLMKLLRKVELASPADSPQMQGKDTILCERFAAGLADPSLQRDVRRHLQEHKGESFASLRGKVLEWEMPSLPVSGVRSARVSADHGQLQQRLDQQEEQLRATQAAVDRLCQQLSHVLAGPPPKHPTGATQNRRELTCYSCGGRGHIARVCPTGRGRNSSPAGHNSKPPSSQPAAPHSNWAEATPFVPTTQDMTPKTTTKSPNASPPS